MYSLQRLIFLFCFLLIIGCSNDKPVPEASPDKTNIKLPKVAANEVMAPNQLMKVNHLVKGHNVYIECMLSDFTFKKSGGKKREGEGHLILFIDGKKVEEIASAAFIVKDLKEGNHTIKLSLAHNDSTSYYIEKDIPVSIY